MNASSICPDAHLSPVPAPQAFSRCVLRRRYCAPGETEIADVHRRVADAMALREIPSTRQGWSARFRQAMEDGFIPAGRICRNAGLPDGMLINCFVQPIGEGASSTGGCDPGIAMAEASRTLSLGGGVGYDLSPLTPAGAKGMTASGALFHLALLDDSAALAQVGERGFAQMAVLAIDHPDIFEFIAAKRQQGQLSSFNLSVGITDAFMHALMENETVALCHAVPPRPGPAGKDAQRLDDGRWVYRRLPARTLWHALVEAAHACGDPGVLFLDTIRREDNLAYRETISAANPCAEQPLPAYGSCCLGSMNVPAFVRDPFTSWARIDWDRLDQAARLSVRMLDNALDLTTWPLPQHRDEALSTRRIGLGITGLGDALMMLGLAYASASARKVASQIIGKLRDSAYAASIQLARERGPFPVLNRRRFLRSGYAQRLPGALRDAILAHGIRNSHLISIAPAGSISVALADGVSGGIEPIYAASYRQAWRGSDGGWQTFRVENHACRLYRMLAGLNALPDVYARALDISPMDHLRMLAALAPYVDAGISKTINLPMDYSVDALAALYVDAWRWGIKGVTSYRDISARGPISEEPAALATACMPGGLRDCEGGV